MRLSRRDVLRGSTALGVSAGAPAVRSNAAPADVPAPVAALTPMTDGVSPITTDEHRRRIARAQVLMAAEGLKALVLSSGTSLTYFTGAEWGESERFFGAAGSSFTGPLKVVVMPRGSRLACRMRWSRS